MRIEAALMERVVCRCPSCGKVLVASQSVVPAVVREAGDCAVCGRAYDIEIEHLEAPLTPSEIRTSSS